MRRIFQWGVFLILLAACVSLASADFVNVPWAAFKGDKHDEGYDINQNSVEKEVDGGYLYAGVNFPEGAVIKNIRVLLRDNSVDYNVMTTLIRCNMFTGDYVNLFSVWSSGSSADPQSLVDSSTDVASNRKVYNNVLSYGVQLRFDGGDENIDVFGVTIEYE